jgi:hypothetical protein
MMRSGSRPRSLPGAPSGMGSSMAARTSVRRARAP